AAPGGDAQGGGGGQVEGACAVSTRAAGIDGFRGDARDREGVRAQHAGGADQLLDALALLPQPDEEGCDLSRGGVAAQHGLHDRYHLGFAQIAARDQALDGGLRRHRGAAARARRRARKLPRSALPCSVRIDSGWDCTPSTKPLRWPTPLIAPSAVQALRGSLGGGVPGWITRE